LRGDGKEMVIFGGDTAIVVCGDTPKHEHAGDTWILDTGCGRWKEITAMPAPGARARHAMALDDKRDRAILFGGRTRPSGSMAASPRFNDVCAFDFKPETWSEIKPSGTAPSARSNMTVVIDGDDLIVFGGSPSPSGLSFTPKNDTFALDLVKNEWREIKAAN